MNFLLRFAQVKIKIQRHMDKKSQERRQFSSFRQANASKGKEMRKEKNLSNVKTHVIRH